MRFCAFLLFVAPFGPGFAAVVGTNPVPQPLTVERLSVVPEAERAAWKDYLARSAKQREVDATFYAAELKSAGLDQELAPSTGGSLKLEEDPAWYAGAEARRIAANIVSFQTPAGGWNKNTDMTRQPRRPGERSGHEKGYVGTFDNDATTSHLTFLAKVVAASGSADHEVFEASFRRGLDYVFSSQYPNGGWPQVWPLQGDYHDAITYNDGAMVRILILLQDVSSGAGDYAFVPKPLQEKAREAFKRGVSCVLATQIVHEGRRTVWCQQHDPLTLAPAPARAYEMPSQSSSESAGLTFFLMKLPDQTPEVTRAVEAAVAWFRKTSLPDVVFKASTKDGKKDGRRLIPTPGAKPLWPRYAEIGSDRPLFGERDRSILDSVDDVSKERRDGYAWFGDHGNRVLSHYEKWLKGKESGKTESRK